MALGVTFLRCNERHHSIAVAATRGVAVDMFSQHIQHLNLEVASREELTATFERCKALGCKITRNIGQHPNDRELSFYVQNPSGFEFEIGWDALAVDETTWQAGMSYPMMSNWGHETPGRFSSELGVGHVVNSVRSLGREEYFPW